MPISILGDLILSAAPKRCQGGLRDLVLRIIVADTS
ncbi:hypothetical protein SAMN04488563_2326 [Jiangella alkaliphila]|uniref:Uncharacterized protein n=1 Tax=Jiangella alkaliphila TaxID=419479 RepID=A0A1H2J687_9ACTN|nr:hypothetical protein SAMN04488563_2326 [Jiangella alkaliphila]